MAENGNGELIPTHTREQAIRSGGFLQTDGVGLQEIIANIMAEIVIYRFETIQIEKNHGRLAFVFHHA